MQKLRILALPVVAALFLNSCGSQAWDDSQAAALPSLRVAKPTTAEDAYKKPFKISDASQRTGNGVAFATGLAGGFIGGAVGALVVTGVQAADQQKFESDYAEPIERIRQSVGRSFEPAYEEELAKLLRQRPFFAKRLSSRSDLPLRTEIVGYRLNRWNNGSPMEFKATVSVRLNLMGTEETVLLENLVAAGESHRAATLETLAADKKLLNELFREAARNAAANVASLLDQRTEEVADL